MFANRLRSDQDLQWFGLGPYESESSAPSTSSVVVAPVQSTAPFPTGASGTSDVAAPSGVASFTGGVVTSGVAAPSGVASSTGFVERPIASSAAPGVVSSEPECPVVHVTVYPSSTDAGSSAIYTNSTGFAPSSGIAAATSSAPVESIAAPSNVFSSTASAGFPVPSNNSTGGDSTSGTVGESTGSITDSIDEAFVAKGKLYYGTAADQGTLATSEDIINANFGQVTPENSMKWDATEATQNQYTLDGADYLVDYATENGKLIRGHTMIWHSQLPDWVSAIGDADTLTSVMEDHINTVMGRYAGQIYAWVSTLITLIPIALKHAGLTII